MRLPEPVPLAPTESELAVEDAWCARAEMEMERPCGCGCALSLGGEVSAVTGGRGITSPSERTLRAACAEVEPVEKALSGSLVYGGREVCSGLQRCYGRNERAIPRQEEKGATHRQDMHGSLHNDVEEFALPRLRIDSDVVPSLDAEDDLEHVRDGDVTAAVLVRDVKPILGFRQAENLSNRPWARTHEVRNNLGHVILRPDNFR